ncbi:MAG TPA: xanthine dehydrogenase family protein subunit M [Trebonia sp.]|nr:xanthine dehydrogenase family protein subunit M [Trebonia sp.]
MFPADFSYTRATCLEHALTLLGQAAGDGRDAKVIAGGQSLLPLMKLRLSAPELVIDIAGLQELRGVVADGDTTVIGALATYRDLQREADLTTTFPAMGDALAVLADPQVRARGTVGGCVAHGDPAADLPAVLLALDARVTIAGPAGTRTVALEYFLLGPFETDLAPDELVTAITLPAAPAAGMAYEKFEQPASHLPLAGVAVTAEVRDGVLASARVAVTGVAPRPFRATRAERDLHGQPPPPLAPAGGGTASAAAARTCPIAESMAESGLVALSDQHASGPFRVHLAGILAHRALARAAARAAGLMGGGR